LAAKKLGKVVKVQRCIGFPFMIWWGIIVAQLGFEGRCRTMAGQSTDPVMLELFRAELDTHLPVLSEGLLALEKDAAQPEVLEALMRAAHSIKGAARIVGIDAAVQVAHVMEDCLVAAQKGELRLNADAIDVLLRGVDVLTHAEVTQVERVGAMVEELTAVRAGRPPAAPAPADQALVVRNLDQAGSDQLRQLLLQQRQRGVKGFRLDLSAVRDVEPCGLALLALFARLPCLDGSLPRCEIMSATPEIRGLLRLTRLDTVFALAPGQGR
jgi:HPt (histidine-containing phosphotransfer) domain-containing protein